MTPTRAAKIPAAATPPSKDKPTACALPQTDPSQEPSSDGSFFAHIEKVLDREVRPDARGVWRR